MTYEVGQLITASDYVNQVAVKLNEVYADSYSDSTVIANATYGYGQTPPIDNVVIGDTVSAAQWNAILQVIDKLALHQGLTIDHNNPRQLPNPSTALNTTNNIAAFNDSTDGLLAVISALRTGKMTATAAGMSVTNKLVSTKVNATETMEHNALVKFTTYNSARYFFNSGGEIRFNIGLTGGSVVDPVYARWQGIVNSVGTIKIKWDSTTRTGGSASTVVYPIGFYDLTNSYQLMASYSPGDGDRVNVYGRLSDTNGINGVLLGANAKTVQLKIEIKIGNFGAYGYAYSSAILPGTLSSNINEYKASAYITITSPTYVTKTGL